MKNQYDLSKLKSRKNPYTSQVKPAQLKANAYAQGNAIHITSAQDQHSPKDAWHVVTQSAGHVQPTMQMKSANAINDEAGLEREAEALGLRALRRSDDTPS
jgi:hypothetical protein